MAGLNRSILAGRLVADPIIRYTDNETPVANFRLAINYGSKKKGNEATDFVSCVAWAGLAKVVGEYLKKGNFVAVEGRIQSRSYQDKNDQKRSVTEVIVSNLQMLGFSSSKIAAKTEKTDLVEV